MGIITYRPKYFLGIDMAPAQGKKADDGSMVAMKASLRPGVEEPTNIVSDWLTQFVWGYAVRGKDISEWSGLVHEKHRDFGFTGIMLDPQAGGQYLELELMKEKQIIGGVETTCVPIASIENAVRSPNALFILIMFRRREPLIQALWGKLAGDDVLYDRSHVTFQNAHEKRRVQYPKAFNDRDPAETEAWPTERKWALKCLDTVRQQLTDVQVVTEENGMPATTGNGARQFTAKGKKDFAYAAMFAYLRFLLWLQFGDLDGDDAGDGDGGCYAMP